MFLCSARRFDECYNQWLPFFQYEHGFLLSIFDFILSFFYIPSRRLNQWESLIYYLKDGRIPATNNIAEREGIKPFVIYPRLNIIREDFQYSA